MTHEEARDLMASAWETRRRAFGVAPEKKRELLGRAREELKRALARCQDDGTPVLRAQALHLLANVESDLGNPEPARALWEESVSILRGTDDTLQLAHKLRHLGDLHRRCRRPDEAEVHYVEALELYRAQEDPGSLGVANATRSMAALVESRGDTERALELWRETRDLYAAVEVAEGVAEAQGRIDRLSN